MKPVRVCCFCERWESGGIESFLCNVLLHMDLSAMEVDIVTAQLRGSVFTESLKARGVRFCELSGRQNRVPENHRLFRKLLAERQYDVVHLHIFHGLSLWYGCLAKQAGVPVRIAHGHNTALRKSKTRPLKLLVHYISRKLFTRCATDLWACSRAAAEFMFPDSALKSKGFQFIPNGIDTNRFRFDADVREKVRTELGVQGKYVVGNIGRLCYQKNQDFLLDVFYEVLKRRPESILLLVGEGPDRFALEEKTRRLEVAGNVIFYGTSDRVERLLWAMDVFVMPSRFEGLGIAAVEAQAAGLPVIFSEQVPKEAQLSQQFWVLPLHAGAAHWAEKLSEFLGTPERRAESAAAVRRAGFDVADVARQIEQFYLRMGNDGQAQNFDYCTGL